MKNIFYKIARRKWPLLGAALCLVLALSAKSFWAKNSLGSSSFYLPIVGEYESGMLDVGDWLAKRGGTGPALQAHAAVFRNERAGLAQRREAIEEAAALLRTGGAPVEDQLALLDEALVIEKALIEQGGAIAEIEQFHVACGGHDLKAQVISDWLNKEAKGLADDPVAIDALRARYLSEAIAELEKHLPILAADGVDKRVLERIPEEDRYGWDSRARLFAHYLDLARIARDQGQASEHLRYRSAARETLDAYLRLPSLTRGAYHRVVDRPHTLFVGQSELSLYESVVRESLHGVLEAPTSTKAPFQAIGAFWMATSTREELLTAESVAVIRRAFVHAKPPGMDLPDMVVNALQFRPAGGIKGKEAYAIQLADLAINAMEGWFPEDFQRQVIYQHALLRKLGVLIDRGALEESEACLAEIDSLPIEKASFLEQREIARQKLATLLTVGAAAE